MEASDIKRGMHVIVQEHPCRVVDIRRSTISKVTDIRKYHQKIQITGIDVFTKRKYVEVLKSYMIVPTCNISTKEYTLVSVDNTLKMTKIK